MKQQTIILEDNKKIKKRNNLKILKAKEFLTCRMYSYYIKKFFKSIGIIIFLFVLIGIYFFIEIPNVSFPTSSSYNATESYNEYFEMLIFYLIIVSVIFSVVISSLIIKEEIRNKTMLIFASLPMSRKRMFTEQLLSFLTINSFFVFILTFILPLFYLFFGQNSFSFIKELYKNAPLDFLKLLFINMVISIIMLFFVLIFNDKAIKILSPFLAIISFIGLLLPFFFSVSSSPKVLDNDARYNYFALNAKKLGLNNLDEKYLDIEDWFKSLNYTFDNGDFFKPNDPFYYGNKLNSDDFYAHSFEGQFNLSLKTNNEINVFTSKLLNLPKIMDYNFSSIISDMKIDNGKLFDDNDKLSLNLINSLKHINFNNDNNNFSTINTVNSSDYNSINNLFIKENYSLSNYYWKIYQENKKAINKGMVLPSSIISILFDKLIKKEYPKKSDQIKASANLINYLNSQNNKFIYLNDSFLNYIYYSTNVIKVYALAQIFNTPNNNINMYSNENSFNNALNIKRKKLLNTNLLFGLDPFLQFYRIAFNNKWNTVPEEFLGLTGENDFTVPLTKGIITKGKNTYYIIKADMKHNHTAFPIWAIYLFWSLFVTILLVISYLYYSKKDFK